MDLNELKLKIQESVPESEVYILDPMNDGVHLEAIVVSSQFEAKPLVQQHRMVMNPLKNSFQTDVMHALGLKTFTPEKWREVRTQYGF